MSAATYPGTARHQALLAQIVEHYANDARIRAVCLFGSLVRGNWDQYSDLDLDVVIADGVQIDGLEELQSLCAALNERPLLIIPQGDDSGDVVLASLAELSIRYHLLATTSPNIVDELQLLSGTLDLEAIQAAGKANRTLPRSISSADVDRILRWSVEVNMRLQRREFWQAERLLRYMRDTLIDVFAVSRGYARSVHGFEALADDALKARFAATLPHDLESVQAALVQMLDLLESDLGAISNGLLKLTDGQRNVIAKVRAGG